MRPEPARWHAILILALSTLLAACAAPRPAPVQEAGTVERAQAAESRGQFDVAAELWLQHAIDSDEATADAYRLRAAEAWVADGQTQRAWSLLGDIRPASLSPGERSRFALLLAEQALDMADVSSASRYLDMASEDLEPSRRGRFEAIEAGIARVRADTGQAQLLRRIAGDLASFDRFQLARAIEILVKYEYVPSGRLLQAAELQSFDALAASWAELIARVRAAILRAEFLEQAALDWRQSHPDHLVDEQAFLELAFMYGQRFSAPMNVAVMLPLEGSLSAAAKAIRDGVVSAYLARPGISHLRFVDSGDGPLQALATYRQAEQDQVDWVIGPLRQESVEAVADLGLPGIGVLALNDTRRTPEFASMQDFFTLSLSQEAEARSIAASMLETGAERVITLIVDNAWGQRMETAFVEAFIAGGGQISDIARFSLSNSDHSEELVRVLQIDQSRQRKDQLQALLGVPLTFEPSLRNDFDAFFLTAPPTLARQLRPQLRFYEAGDKPLFAVSRVYSGVPDPAADQDLNGVILPLTASQLAATSATALPELESVRGGNLLHLHGLGRDAWNLLPWLTLMQLDPDLAFPGETGTLQLNQRGQLVREPYWAMFDGGRPVPHTPAGAEQ